MSWDVILLQFPPRSQRILNFRAGTTFLFPKAQWQKRPPPPASRSTYHSLSLGYASPECDGISDAFGGGRVGVVM